MGSKWNVARQYSSIILLLQITLYLLNIYIAIGWLKWIPRSRHIYYIYHLDHKYLGFLDIKQIYFIQPQNNYLYSLIGYFNYIDLRGRKINSFHYEVFKHTSLQTIQPFTFLQLLKFYFHFELQLKTEIDCTSWQEENKWALFFKIITCGIFTSALIYTKSNRGNITVLGMMHAFIPSLGTQINLNFRGRHEITFTCSGCPQIFLQYWCFYIWWRKIYQGMIISKIYAITIDVFFLLLIMMKLLKYMSAIILKMMNQELLTFGHSFWIPKRMLWNTHSYSCNKQPWYVYSFRVDISSF